MITYEVFMRHAEKVTKNVEIEAPKREVLKGVYHHPDGSLFVTDSHRLYKADNLHDRQEGALLSPKGKEVKGNFPDVTWLIPVNDPSWSLDIDVSEFIEATDTLYSVGKTVEKNVVVDFKEDKLSFTSIEVKSSYSLSVSFKESVSFRALYWLEATKLFKAAKCRTVTFNFYGQMRPITLVAENLTVLILPVRRH